MEGATPARRVGVVAVQEESHIQPKRDKGPLFKKQVPQISRGAFVRFPLNQHNIPLGYLSPLEFETLKWQGGDSVKLSSLLG